MNLRDDLPKDAAKALRMLDPVSIGVDGAVRDAIAAMQRGAVGCVVVTAGHRLVGIVTERDILTKVLGNNLPLDTPITDVMTRDPQVISEGYSVARVIRTMYEGGFRHMPVVDEAGKLKGIVSVKRVVEYLVEHFPEAVFNLPPKPVQGMETREGA